MKVNIKNFANFTAVADQGHIVHAEVDGQEHMMFRRTQMPVSGGTHTPPHVIVREIADDYALYKEAEAELQNAGDDGEYKHTSGMGAQPQKMKFSSVKVTGPNLVEVKAQVDGQEKTALITGDVFKQKYHQAIALDQPNFFVGAIATELANANPETLGLQDYIGEFEVDEAPQKAQIVDSKNFAQPHFSQHPLTKSKAATAKANWESPKQVTGGGQEETSSEFNGMKSSRDDGGLTEGSRTTTAHWSSDQGTGHAGTDRRTPEEDKKRAEENQGDQQTEKASAAMEPDK